MSKGAAGGQGGQDDSMGVVWVVVAVFAVLGVVWWKFKKQIVFAYLYLKLLEISVISHVTNKLDDISYIIQGTDPLKFSFQDVADIGSSVGYYVRIPCVILIIILAVIVYLTNSTRVFKRTYSMLDLAKEEQKNWPQITPVLGLNLVKQDIDKGPWAMAMTPMQFSKRHQLLQEFKRQPEEGALRQLRQQVEVSLKRGKANKVFSVQLGTPWQGFDRLSPHAQALLAIFVARFMADSKAAADLLRQINLSSSGKLNFSGAKELFKKHEKNKHVQAIINSHGYVLTVMASMLKAARQDGVQASADFLWLKPVERRLWYMLNTIGRQTPFVEVAGPFAHWLAELELGRRILVPMVEEATNALELALKEIIYQPDSNN